MYGNDRAVVLLDLFFPQGKVGNKGNVEFFSRDMVCLFARTHRERPEVAGFPRESPASIAKTETEEGSLAENIFAVF